MKISIITTSYNSEKTIAQTIESVINQKRIDLEYIIIDGFSQDLTMDIVKKHEKNNKNIISISEKDNGMYDAMNKGIKMASGDIIGILNSDDRYAYDTVLYDVANAFKNKKIDCCYGNILYVKNNKPYRYWISGAPRTFKYGWMPPHPAFFVKRDVYDKYGFFRLDCGVNADYEIMLRFLEVYKIKSTWINKTFVLMQAGGRSNNGLQSRIDAIHDNKYAWQKNGLNPGFLTIYLKKIRKLSQYLLAKIFSKRLSKKIYGNTFITKLK
ncbi:glycosyltransferase family 2 protein [Rectinema subterraneum]|jgi:glycosyltransferase involved in cell wall biosynthesis|uniref:glycosyltransferase family 2 protein n=1 Tax=Rectinema subterraneum TaxID=2653714 RepID=UPI00131C5D6A|nr:glycosyltransferase family 2 protein [Rectinema subterraneum]